MKENETFPHSKHEYPTVRFVPLKWSEDVHLLLPRAIGLGAMPRTSFHIRPLGHLDGLCKERRVMQVMERSRTS